ncbi:hypothetical protein [Halopseudomonas yangmingensis]|nr:hypothetical protein [Halopseudomonas yangmingensis]
MTVPALQPPSGGFFYFIVIGRAGGIADNPVKPLKGDQDHAESSFAV